MVAVLHVQIDEVVDRRQESIRRQLGCSRTSHPIENFPDAFKAAVTLIPGGLRLYLAAAGCCGSSPAVPSTGESPSSVMVMILETRADSSPKLAVDVQERLTRRAWLD